LTVHEVQTTLDVRFVQRLQDSLGSFHHESGLEAACHAALHTTGKLLRPRILLAVASAGGVGEPPRGAIDAAVAVELLHLASLAHDDVIDEAETRRSMPAVQARYGATAALLAGGWLFSYGMELVSALGRELAVEYADTASAMCAGQLREVEETGDIGRTEAAYFAVIEGKTAALFIWAARAGATLAGLAPPLVEQAGRFGAELGMAYQIIDDLLDLTATTEALGKAAFADLRAGIYTLPVILAMERDPAIGELLAAGGVDVRRIAALTRAGGGLGSAYEEARRRLAGAREAVAWLPSAPSIIPIVDRIASMLDGVDHA
jgi:heptaprenyl diphosphate synthase